MLAFDVLMRWFDVVAQLTALSVLLGPMKKYVPSTGLTRFVLGGACGGFSSLEMLQPLVAAPGIILDLRTLPVAIAAGFLGRGGGIAALAVALVTRVSIGGVGAYAAVLGLIVVALAGLFWARRFGLDGKHSLAQLMLLGVVPSLSLPFFLIIPGSVGWDLLHATLPIYVPLNMAAVLLVGWVIDRERFLLLQHKKLEVESRTDHLTGLLNRRGLEAEFDRLLPNDIVAALHLVDFDHFKEVNDQYGHAGGDQVLVSVARRIVSEVGSQALIARLGGDEFAVVRLVNSESQSDDLVDRLIKKVRSTPIPLICGATVTASVSIGSAKWISGESLHSLLLRADQSLYGAKASAKIRRSTQKRSASPYRSAQSAT
jgi:diguanylate cyclase